MAKKIKEDLIAKTDKMLSEGVGHCSIIHSRIRENQKYERGLQWSKGDMERQAERERPAIPNNSLIKVINAIANKEITDRFEPRVFGRSDFDNGVATVLDKGNRWQRDMSESEHDESLAFRSNVGSGIGVMHKWFDGNAWDGEGKIIDEEVPVWSMLWPVKARQMNLADRRWHVYGKVMATSEAEYIFGDINKGTKSLFKKIGKERDLFMTKQAGGDWGTNKLAATGFSTLSWDAARRGLWYNVSEEEVFVIEAEWKESRVVQRAAVPTKFEEVWALFSNQAESIPYEVPAEEGGEPQETEITRDILFGETAEEGALETILHDSSIMIYDDIEEFDSFRDRYEELTGSEFVDYSRVTKEIVKYAIRIDDVIIDSGERPYGFTFEFMTGWRNEGDDFTDWYGLIDVAKGPQDFKNAMLSAMLATYMTSAKNTILMSDGALSDPIAFANKYAGTGGVIYVPPAVVQGEGTVWKQLESNNFPPMQQGLLEIAYNGIEELFGLSSIDLGTQGDLRRVSGNVVQAAKAAANTIVATFFDSLRRYRKRFGTLNLQFITQHYTPQQLLRIIGEENAPDVENLPDSWGNILKYDVKVEESPVSASEKMELLSKLQQVGSLDNWLEKGYITFEMMVDDLIPGLPESFKRKVKDHAAGNDQKDQEIQSLQQQMQELQAYQSAMTAFITQQGGKDLIDQFGQVAGMAEPMARQMLEEYNSSQEGQPAQEEQSPQG